MLLNAWRALVVRWAAKVSGVLLRRRRNVKGESDARGSEACHWSKGNRCTLDGVDWTGRGVVNCGGGGGADEDAEDEDDDDDVDVDVAARLGFSC